jgi:hypothetical protein
MTVFLPILPVVLLGLFCTIAGYWSLRAIDRFLAEHPETANPSQSSSGVESQVRLPR